VRAAYATSASIPNLCMKAISYPVRPERSRVAAESKDCALAHSFKMDTLLPELIGSDEQATPIDRQRNAGDIAILH
jgi:hypothetical protein